ncbi:MAG: hypothetical protein IVW57_14795 [Ktedonobacterales bacterium]|nr:hypothetical protein [Ktedonobacterales bacterium]
MADVMGDWRLFGQHEHLRGATLWWRAYTPPSEVWTHDQCEFCWATFARGTAGDTLREGFATAAERGATGRSEVRDSAEDDEYITGVFAAVQANPAPNPPPVTEEDVAALEATVLAAIALPATPGEPPVQERVHWICLHCFEDFKDVFAWRMGSATATT